MESINLDQFRDDFQNCVDQVIDHHHSLKVNSDSGSGFVVLNAEEWEQIQETLYVLQNKDLMQQIARSLATQEARQGYHPSTEETNEILGI
jgi:antitoxin YefM